MNKVRELKSKVKVVNQFVVLDAGLSYRFEKKIAELGMKKSTAVGMALTVWLNMVDRSGEGEQDGVD